MGYGRESYIPKGIPELPDRQTIDDTDIIALACGDVANFKTYRTTVGGVENKISDDFQNFKLSTLTADRISANYISVEQLNTDTIIGNDRMFVSEICCSTLCASYICADTIDIPGTNTDVQVTSDCIETRDLPADLQEPIYCLAMVSSENGKVVGHSSQRVPDSRYDVNSLSVNVEDLLDKYASLNTMLNNLRLSVEGIQNDNESNSNMNLAIDTKNIIDITQMIPYGDKLGTTGESQCSAFYELPFGGTLGINLGHYYTIDSYDTNTPTQVSPYLFAKSGASNTSLNATKAISNTVPTIFVKVNKGMNIATSNPKTNESGKEGGNTIKNCIILYPQLDDDLFSSDKTIEISKMLYDIRSSSTPHSEDEVYYGNVNCISSYDYYKNTTTDKQKYQVMYIDLQNKNSKKAAKITCSIFRCYDPSNSFDQHYLSGNNSPIKLEKNKYNNYSIKLDTFTIEPNSTMTRRYVISPEDILLLYDANGSSNTGLPVYKSTQNTKTKAWTNTPNATRRLGNDVILLSRGYVDIKENSEYHMTIDINKLTKETDLVNLSNMNSFDSTTTKTFDSLVTVGQKAMLPGTSQEIVCNAAYSDGTVVDVSKESEFYLTKPDGCDFVTIDGNAITVDEDAEPTEEGEGIELFATYTDYGTSRQAIYTLNIVESEQIEYEISGDSELAKNATGKYYLLSSYNTDVSGTYGDPISCAWDNDNKDYAEFIEQTDEYGVLSAKDQSDDGTTVSANIGTVAVAEKQVELVETLLLGRFGSGTLVDESGLIVQFYDSNGEIQTRELSSFNAYEELKNYENFQLSVFGTETVPIKRIGNNVFSNTACVNAVNIPNTVLEMGYDVFKNCTTLSSVNIPFISETLSSVFEGCSSLVEVKTAGTLQNIGDNFYKDCTALENIVIPKKTTTIGNQSFMNCHSVKDMVILDNLENLDGTAFVGCSSLTGFTVSKNNTYITENDGILYGENYSRLITNPVPKDLVNVRQSVVSVDTRSFEGTDVANVRFGSNVTDIGTSAFYDCKHLSSITFLPENCPNIFTGAFRANGDFEFDQGTVYLTPTNFENYTYYDSEGNLALCCENLPLPAGTKYNGRFKYHTLPFVFKMLTNKNKKFDKLKFYPLGYDTDTANQSLIVDFGDGDVSSVSLTSTCGVANKAVAIQHDYTNSSVDDTFKSNPIVTARITNADMNVISVGNMFNSYTQVSEIWLPSTLEKIGDNFANGSTSLTSVHIDSCTELTSIGNNSFKGTNIEQISLPQKIKSIGTYAFNNCAKLKYIDLSANSKLESIPDYMCYSCKALTYVNLSSAGETSLKTIGTNAFTNTALETLILPNTLTAISKNAFNGCSKLSSRINLPQITNIGSNVFESCSQLTQLSIGCESNTSDITIGSSAFSGCTGILSIWLNASAEQFLNDKGTTIGSKAFYNVGMKFTDATGSYISESGFNRIYIPHGQLTSFVDTSNNKWTKKVANLPEPVNPGDTATKHTGKFWVYVEMPAS